MQAQEALNEDAHVEGQVAEILAGLNDSDVENQAPINHIDDYMEDYMMDKDKEFDDELLDEDYISRSDAYKMLSLQSTKKYKANITRQFHKMRSAKRTHIVCVTDKNAASLAECLCSYHAVIKRKRTKDESKYYIEKEGRNLEHNVGCLRNSANCPGNTTVRSEFMQHVKALHPISLATTGKEVAMTLAEKERMIVPSKQAKSVLNKRNGITRKVYRNSFKEFPYHEKFFNEEGNAKMELHWRTNAEGVGLAQNGNKYFRRYEICATGIRNFVARVGIPFYSFDACFSKHLYYTGVYGNLVALVDTKAASLTNVPVALTTEESELESLYSGLFKVSGCNNADSELAKQMKEQLSCVIGDGAPQFFNAAQSTLGIQKSIATCSLHVKENARKRCKSGWNEKLFWRLQKARSRRERDTAWADIQSTYSPAAVNYLRAQLDDDMSAHGRPWTRFAHRHKEICTFGRKGTNNPVEQEHSKQVPMRHHEPNRFLLSWGKTVREREDIFLTTAEKLVGKILTPWADRIFENNHDAMRTIISKKFTGALFQEPSKQCELLLALLFFFLTGCQNGPKWAKNAPNGRYHAPDFSFKNAKLRLNIIIINILRAARVFIAFTFPQPSENEV